MSEKIWSFNRNHKWESVDCPLDWETHKLEELTMKAAGYVSGFSIGEEFGVELCIWNHKNGTSIIGMTDMGFVFLPDAPASWEFLRVFAPLVTAGQLEAIREHVSEAADYLFNDEYGICRDAVMDKVSYYQRLRERRKERVK